MYAVCGQDTVEGVSAGVYHYTTSHALLLEQPGDVRQELARAALDQGFIAQAPVTLVIGAIYARTAEVYGERAARYVHMEVGHAGQNIYLQAAALGLATVAVGAFDDERVKRVLRLEAECQPLYIMPVGFPAEQEE